MTENDEEEEKNERLNDDREIEKQNQMPSLFINSLVKAKQKKKNKSFNVSFVCRKAMQCKKSTASRIELKAMCNRIYILTFHDFPRLIMITLCGYARAHTHNHAHFVEL